MSELYELSIQLRYVLNQFDDVMKLHCLRYSYFVDGSPRKEDCTYARQTERLLRQDLDNEINQLTQIRNQFDQIISKLQGMKDE